MIYDFYSVQPFTSFLHLVSRGKTTTTSFTLNQTIMKKQLKQRHWIPIFLLIGLIFNSISNSEATTLPPYGPTFKVFYQELSPYGDWVRDARHGYVWLPYVDQGFHPYATEGHWVMTEFGNTWVSYYDWGWAPFHYGRWYFDNFYQSWAWVPGYEWGPAWVSWRTGGGYYGWAPLRPGFSISVSFGIPSFHFVFAPRQRIYAYNVYSYCPPRARRVNIYHQTTIINNTVVYNNNQYVAGPSRREVRRVTGGNVPEYSTQNSGTRGRRVVAQDGRTPLQANRQIQSRNSTSRSSERELSTKQRSRNNSATRVDTGMRNDSRSSREINRSQGRSQSKAFETRPYQESQRNAARSKTSRSSQPKVTNRSKVNTRSSRATQSKVQRSQRVSPPNNQRQRSKASGVRKESSSKRSTPEVQSRTRRSTSSSPRSSSGSRVSKKEVERKSSSAKSRGSRREN